MLKGDVSLMEFDSQAFVIGRLKQARTECAMYMNGCASYFVAEFFFAKSFSVRVGPIVATSTRPVATMKLAIRQSVPCRLYSNSTRSIRPGLDGFFGASRSNACIPVFSSEDTV